MRFVPLIILFIIAGCSWLVPTPKKTPTAKGVGYKLKYKSSEWSEVKQKQSDFVFQNKEGSTLVINSFCGAFQDEPLKFLAEKTFNGLESVKNKTEKAMTISNREAHLIEAIGGIDGVSVNIKVINMRRNNCYYDFVRITPEGVKPTANQPEDLISAMEFLP
jgi:hypothetical protein